MIKRSKNYTLNRNFYFTLYSLIKEGNNPTKICSILNLKKQHLNYYLRHLKANGYIEKIGYGVWKTSKNFDFNTISKTGKKNIRSHAFIFSILLPRISNWNKRTEFLKIKKIPFQTFKNRNQQKLTFKGYKMQVSDKKIVIYFSKWKSYFVNSAKTGENYALYDLKQLLISLENMFNVNFKINKEYIIKVGRRHHAMINSELAKMFTRDHKKLYVRDEEGILRLLIDDSVLDGIGLKEEEAVSQENAVSDIEIVKKNYLELFETKLTPKTVLSLINKIAEQTLKNSQNQEIYNENIKKHLKVLDKMEKTLDDISKGINNKV